MSTEATPRRSFLGFKRVSVAVAPLAVLFAWLCQLHRVLLCPVSVSVWWRCTCMPTAVIWGHLGFEECTVIHTLSLFVHFIFTDCWHHYRTSCRVSKACQRSGRNILPSMVTRYSLFMDLSGSRTASLNGKWQQCLGHCWRSINSCRVIGSASVCATIQR
jgi:hypothetical protein